MVNCSMILLQKNLLRAMVPHRIAPINSNVILFIFTNCKILKYFSMKTISKTHKARLFKVFCIQMRDYCLHQVYIFWQRFVDMSMQSPLFSFTFQSYLYIDDIKEASERRLWRDLWYLKKYFMILEMQVIA